MSSDGERSPKRQRQSYSPASPNEDIKTTSAAWVQPPQTPPPSVHMSPSWHGQQMPASLPAMATSTSATETDGATFPTPPSTAGFMNQAAGGVYESDNVADDEGHPGDSHARTPDQDIESERKRKRETGDDGESEGRIPSKRPHLGEGDMVKTTSGEDAHHTRTDHERKEDMVTGAETQTPAPPAPKLYRLHTSPPPPSRPHPSENMLALYSLETLQASVARKDAAGNKINKLRKSYENKVKALGLEGRSKAQVGNSALEGLVDPGWDHDMGGGTTVWQQQRVAENPRLASGKGGVDDLLDKLGSALNLLQPGQLPRTEHEHWKGMLGLDETNATPITLQATKVSSAAPLSSFLARTGPGKQAASRASAPASPRDGVLGNVNGNSNGPSGGAAVRPERSGKRRRYDESSYEGYDDEGSGYHSAGGIDDAARRKKLKQQQQLSQQQQQPQARKGGEMLSV